MNTRTTLTEIFDKIINDSKRIPAFINTTSEDHHRAFLILSDLLTELANIVLPRIMTDKEIFKFLIVFEEIASSFEMVESMPLYLSCTSYINKRIDYYISMAETLDEWETVSNLTTFKDYRDQYTSI